MVTVQVSPTRVYQEPKSGWILYRNTVAANNATDNVLAWTTPADINPNSYIRQAVVTTTGAQTHHVVAGDTVAVHMTMERGGQRHSVDITSERILDGFNGGGGTAENLWTCQFNPIYLQPYTIEAGDLINFVCPPSDDGGSPTGDYILEIMVQERGT